MATTGTRTFVRSTSIGGLGLRRLAAPFVAASMLAAMLAVAAPAAAAQSQVVYLSNDDFTYGTYVIDRPGTYKLAEDISFDPNSPEVLTAALTGGSIPAELAGQLDLPNPVDAYRAGFPLFTQLSPGGITDFTPGGPLDARYDPAAFGVGFFAAVAIIADDVVLDLDGHVIEQSPGHALLQRFFAVIELADQPFVPNQGPASFGTALEAAHNVTIRNGTIGRSSHHGIHGNANAGVIVEDVDFVDYEVAAIALNGVDGLTVRNVSAVNRKDVPVIGTFSSARFIQAYIDHLVRIGSTTTLSVDGVELTAADIQARLREAINATYRDLVREPNLVDGRAQIDAMEHPDEYAVFHNGPGLLDGNSYSFVVNNLGVAVNGFPSVPDGIEQIPSRNIVYENVVVRDQHAFINEIVAIDAAGAAVIDPVGAVFQVRNLHPDTGRPVTISHMDDADSRYVGNPISNAQAIVAKAVSRGEFEQSHLDVTRSNMLASVLDWIEGQPGSETLADIGIGYICNGDSMFHVNKGVIGFKMDAAQDVALNDTLVDGLVNLGVEGSARCGEYLHGFSHPLATRYGYGGSAARGYTFAGSTNVEVNRSSARNIVAAQGPAVGFEVMTDSVAIPFAGSTVQNVIAGQDWTMAPGGSTESAKAIGFRVSPDAQGVSFDGGCASSLLGAGGEWLLYDESEIAVVSDACAAWTEPAKMAIVD